MAHDVDCSQHRLHCLWPIITRMIPEYPTLKVDAVVSGDWFSSGVWQRMYAEIIAALVCFYFCFFLMGGTGVGVSI